MFSTFTTSLQSTAGGRHNGNGGTPGAPAASPPAPRPTDSSESSAQTASAAPLRTKPKRHQVARACDWCRVHRIKCDNNVPCRNCKSRGGQCSNTKGANEVRSLPHAYREIERLRERVKELESQLQDERTSSSSASVSSATNRFNAIAISPMPTPPASSKGASPPDINTLGPDQAARVCWEGIHTNTAHSPHKTWYGPSSLYYFISRMNTYLSAALQQPGVYDHIQPLNSIAKAFASPDCNPSDEEEVLGISVPKMQPGGGDGGGNGSGVKDQLKMAEFLTPTQEEYFLSLFWQSYHSSLLVLNEDDFKEHWKSLFVTPGRPRRQSALVDIVIAMSMQYGMAIIPRNTARGSDPFGVDADDATIAGRWYYRRCQTLLEKEVESPTISTLQCQILSIIYLCCASFQNMAHSTCALAARTAQMLGFHMEPPDGVPPAERELRKRLWWSLYTVETKTSMKLGRPFYVDLVTTTCTLPADDHEAAMLAGSNFAPVSENVTWLSYNLHNTKLVLAARSVHQGLYDRYANVYSGDKGRDIYDDAAALEQLAEHLGVVIGPMKAWADSVPDALKTKRQGDGQAFSTDRSLLAIEPFAPLWLQRQRLLLELLYHNLILNLYRPFTTFPSFTSAPSPFSGNNTTTTTTTTNNGNTNNKIPNPLADTHATMAAHHAMAMTQMMYQTLSDTELLAGWNEGFQWQWNAALTLVGFYLAQPLSPVATHVRKAIDHAVVVFEIFGRSFAVAASAAAVTRDLATKADFLVRSTGEGLMGGDNQQRQQQQQDHTGLVDMAGLPGAGGDMGMMVMDEENITAMQDVLAGSMDMAISVDSFNSLEMLWPNMGDMPEEWSYNFNAPIQMNG